MSGPITTHVLDTARGWPAAGVAVTLERAGPDGAWAELTRGATDADGRLRNWLPADFALAPGDYRLRFATGDYHRAQGLSPFYPEVVVHVRIDRPGGHYHLPILLSPFGYSTYRGS
jgi:5-hydroxyisourate hydrolase